MTQPRGSAATGQKRRVCGRKAPVAECETDQRATETIFWRGRVPWITVT
jgi:hypothetical protein